MNQTHFTIPIWLTDSHALSVILVDSSSRRLYHNPLYQEQFLQSGVASSANGFAWDSLSPDDVPFWCQSIRMSQERPGLAFALHTRMTRANGDITDMHWLHIGLPVSGTETTTLCIGYPPASPSSTNTSFGLNDTFLPAITDGMYILDPSFRFVHINPAAEVFLGSKAATLTGKILWEAFPQCSEDLCYPGNILSAFFHQQTTDFEHYSNRLKAWVRVVSYPSPAGLVVMIRDITHEKTAKDKVKESENKLRSILNTTLESNFLVDINYKIISFNKISYSEVKKYFNINLYEGLDIRTFIPHSVMDTFLKDFKRSLYGESLLNDILLEFPKSERWYKIGFSPAYGNDGELIGVSFVAADIDDFKRSQLKLEQQYKQLREIADIQSHLVRRPLASILGLLSLIDTHALNPEASEIIDLVHYATYELDTIIHEIVEKT